MRAITFQSIAKSIRELLGIEATVWSRSITLPPREELGKGRARRYLSVRPGASLTRYELRLQLCAWLALTAHIARGRPTFVQRTVTSSLTESIGVCPICNLHARRMRSHPVYATVITSWLRILSVANAEQPALRRHRYM